MFLEREAKMDTPLRTVRPNIVQSIRAFRVPELQGAATALGQHFLYANLSSAQSKQDVLDMIAAQYTFPAHFGKNFDALFDCMTDLVHKSGQQPGFVVVLEQMGESLQVQNLVARLHSQAWFQVSDAEGVVASKKGA